MKMEPIVSSETSAIRTQTPGNYPKRNNLHLEHGESLRTRWYILSVFFSSKCSLFHNSNLFGSCFIHILYTGVLKFKKIIPAPKG